MRALADVEGRRPTMRLMVAIAYVEDVSQTDLATWYGPSRKTVYNWLQRIDETVAEPPAAAGYDVEDWSASLLQTHLESTYEVTYSRRHCQRLLRELQG